MRVWLSEVAKEDLINNSICIKDHDGIRNIQHSEELNTELFVFVSNMLTVDDVNDTKKLLPKGTFVRCGKVNI